MPLQFGGTDVQNITYNNATVKKVTYNGTTVWEYKEPVTNLYPLETKSFEDTTYTNATLVNADTALVGRAVNPNTSSSGHNGMYVKLPLPSNWDAVNSMKLHFYRVGGSAAGSTNFGAVNNSWTDALSFVQIWNTSQRSAYEADRISATITGGAGWKEVDITSLKERFIEYAKDGYFILTIMSASAYMSVDGSISGDTVLWVEIA